jgi:hypothetical protein
MMLLMMMMMMTMHRLKTNSERLLRELELMSSWQYLTHNSFGLA